MQYPLAPFIALFLLLAGQTMGAEPSPLPRGHVLLETDFEGADGLRGWSGSPRQEAGYQGGQALCIERKAEAGLGSSTAQIALPVEKMRGYTVVFSGMVKAENVSKRPNAWNGVKFMAPIVTADGEKSWPQGRIDVGTFDWTAVSFPVRVPENARLMTLNLGLESVTGKVWFDKIRLVVWKPPVVAKPRTLTGPVYKGHDLPRLRGAMISPNINEEGLRVLGQQWGANLVRWQLIRTGQDRRTGPDSYEAWLEASLKKLDAGLPLCEKYGLRVVIDLHSPPGGKPTSGGYAGSDDRLFTDPDCQKRFVELWEQIARRYRNAKAVWGYDLANEPVESGFKEGLSDWQELAERAARAVRAIDPDRAIIVEPAPWGGPSGMRELLPLDVPNVVYSFHMYIPGSFTHQGVHGAWKPCSYPGTTEGKHWDKAQLEAAMRPAIDFQRTYGVHIYVGEFSAIRWAPDGSACRYLTDLIELFESHGWDWSYHAFREWDGWSVEHGSDPKDRRPAAEPTDREKLLRAWFAKNGKE